LVCQAPSLIRAETVATRVPGTNRAEQLAPNSGSETSTTG